MSITIPPEITWLFPIVVGESWPEGDEDKLRALGDAWRAGAVDVDEVISQAQGAADQALAGMQGEAADAFREYWGTFVEGADAYLNSLKKACEDLGDSCDNCALEVEYAKYSIIAALILLAIEIAALIAAAFGTFGASTAGIPIAQAATRITVQMIFRQLIMAILREMLVEVGIDVAIQGLQMAKGDRHSWDWSKTGNAALSGAISGAIGGGLDFVPTRATGLGGNIAEGAVKGAVTGVGTTVATAAVTGQDITGGDLLRAGVSGGVGGGIGGAKSHYDTPTVNTPDAPGTPGSPGAPGSPGTPGTPGSPGSPSTPGSPSSPGSPSGPDGPGAGSPGPSSPGPSPSGPSPSGPSPSGPSPSGPSPASRSGDGSTQLSGLAPSPDSPGGSASPGTSAPPRMPAPSPGDGSPGGFAGGGQQGGSPGGQGSGGGGPRPSTFSSPGSPGGYGGPSTSGPTTAGSGSSGPAPGSSSGSTAGGSGSSGPTVGGSGTGGPTAGGSNSSGPATGGPGGPTTGGSGGPTPGGPGGSTPGGSGGPTTGGSSSGGSGGPTAGGSGPAPGGPTAGGPSSGGPTAGGSPSPTTSGPTAGSPSTGSPMTAGNPSPTTGGSIPGGPSTGSPAPTGGAPSGNGLTPGGSSPAGGPGSHTPANGPGGYGPATGGPTPSPHNLTNNPSGFGSPIASPGGTTPGPQGGGFPPMGGGTPSGPTQGGHNPPNSPSPGDNPTNQGPPASGYAPMGGAPMGGSRGGPDGNTPWAGNDNGAPPNGYTSSAGASTATPPAFTDPGTHNTPSDRMPDQRGVAPQPNQGFAGPGHGGQPGGPRPDFGPGARPAFGPGAGPQPGPRPDGGPRPDLGPRPEALNRPPGHPGAPTGPRPGPQPGMAPQPGTPAPRPDAGPRPDTGHRPDAGPRPDTAPAPDRQTPTRPTPDPDVSRSTQDVPRSPASDSDTPPTDPTPTPDNPINGEDSDGPTPEAAPEATPEDSTPTDNTPPIKGEAEDGPPADENGVPLNFLGNQQGEHPYAVMGDYIPMGGDRSNGMGSYDQRVAPLIADHNPWGVHDSRDQFNQHHRPDGTYRTNRWPDNDGAVPGSERQVTLPEGTVLDRFGGENGRFLSPLDSNGQPYHYRDRAIFPDNAEVGYHVYVVTDPGGLPGTLADVAPALGQPGGGRQFTLPEDVNVKRLLAEGVIREVYVPPSDGRVLPDTFGQDRGDGTPSTDTVTVDDARDGDPGTDPGTDTDRGTQPDGDGPPQLPDNLQQIADDSSFRTPAGAALFDPTDIRTRNAADAVAPIDGHFVIDVHSDGRNAIVNGQRLDGADLAALARHLGWNGTDPIILNGCEAGRHPDGLAADLARASGAQVIAPTERSWSGEHNTTPYSSSVDTVDDSGRARPTIPPDGGWRAFDPDGTVHDTGSNGLPVDNQQATSPADPSDDTQDGPAPTPGDTGREPFGDDVDRGRVQSVFNPPTVTNPNDPVTIPVDGDAAASADPDDPHRPLRDGERLIGRDGLTPNTRYHVPGRGDYYTNDDGVITHADLEVSNQRDGIKASGADLNPDASYPNPNTTYRVAVDGATHVYTTDDAGMPPRYVEWTTPRHDNTVTFPATGPGVPPNSPLAPGEALSDRTGWPPYTEIVHNTPNGTTTLYTGPPDPNAGGTARVVAIDTFPSPSGAAADRNPDANNFPPDTVTRLNGDVYVTNEHGVTYHATDERTYGHSAPRSQWSQDLVAARGGAGTDGGHIRPTQADGAPDARNQFPQDSNENRPQRGQPSRETWYGQDMEAGREQRRNTDHEWHDFETEGAYPSHPARPQVVHERWVMRDSHGRIRVHFRRYDN